ncbi:MAG TPA: molybdenum cofactor guanylyltransferase [Isosphaeraceae bacterium]|nr:molybdenum cofactor guanylyltransferase [Isosphaeraceae bacterium]
MIDETPGALVLCGGESRRMGRPKAWLNLGSETLLQRAVRLLEPVSSPIVVVAAEGQDLPDLANKARVVRDRAPGLGPLEALRAGLEALEGLAEWAYVCGTDAPFLEPAWVRTLVRLKPGYDLVLPVEGDRMHPLAALYRLRPTRSAAETMLAEDDRRLSALADRLRTLRLDVESLRPVDPALATLRNLNHPSDYERAVRDLGSSVNSFGPHRGS